MNLRVFLNFAHDLLVESSSIKKKKEFWPSGETLHDRKYFNGLECILQYAVWIYFYTITKSISLIAFKNGPQKSIMNQIVRGLGQKKTKIQEVVCRR